MIDVLQMVFYRLLADQAALRDFLIGVPLKEKAHDRVFPRGKAVGVQTQPENTPKQGRKIYLGLLEHPQTPPTRASAPQP